MRRILLLRLDGMLTARAENTAGLGRLPPGTGSRWTAADGYPL